MDARPPLRLRPVTLGDQHVRLEPLEERHAAELWPAASESEMWRYMLFDVATVDDLAAWIRARRVPVAQGTAVPFLQRHAGTGEAVGSTSLFGLDPENRIVEIGHTWIGRAHRGTDLNVAAKRLLLAHAFDELGMVRVQLKCDARNARSRAAIARLGATFEGILRAHRVLPDGTYRDTAMFSVVRSEWPEVRARLDGLLGELPYPEP